MFPWVDPWVSPGLGLGSSAGSCVPWARRFASKTAAVAEPFADASVGNVTGSNSVNVFLGLGLAWSVGALYWQSAGRTIPLLRAVL